MTGLGRVGADRLDQRDLGGVLPDPGEDGAPVGAERGALAGGHLVVERVEDGERVVIHRDDHRVRLHDRRAGADEIAGGLARADGGDRRHGREQLVRQVADRRRAAVAVGDVVVAPEDEEAREAAVLQRAGLQRLPERARAR